MTKEITQERKIIRYWDLGYRTAQVVEKHNDLSVKLFKSISNFSSLLPDNLNSLSTLSDMITDALVVSGRSSLSKSSSELVQSNGGLRYSADTGELTLDYKVQYNAAIKNKKSYIQTDGIYNIYSADKKSLASFEDLLSGSGITIESKTKSFRYTLCIEFATQVDINSLQLKLNTDTDSYPLISEMFYINRENKREYITFLNSLDTKFDLDNNRVKDNNYNLLFNNIKTNRIYFTLEDRDKTDLVLDSLSFRKLKYVATGSIIFGPIVSTYPILKASVEAAGDIEGASFFISYDKENWTEVALPTEISKDATVNKIVSFNTISKDSLKVTKDVKELYLKVDLEQKKITSAEEMYINKSLDFYANVLPYPANDKPVNTSVYQLSNQTYYGDKSFVSSVETSSLREPEHNYIITNGGYMVKSFTGSTYGYDDSTNMSSVTTSVMYKKVNGDRVDASGFEPLSVKTFGYSVNKVKKTCNVVFEENVVLYLNSSYPRDIYTVRQNNKELKLDLSLGFIDSCISSVIGVAEEGSVLLYDSTGRDVKELTIRKFGEDFFYISLVEEGLFELPIMGDREDITLNTLYPIRLNDSNEFGLLDGKLTSVKSLVDFNEVSILSREEIPHSLSISKENKNSLSLTDTLLKDKYTESTTETVEAYLKSRAIKLKNKHIQKGSLRITQL